jgi:hypothetical protein
MDECDKLLEEIGSKLNILIYNSRDEKDSLVDFQANTS